MDQVKWYRDTAILHHCIWKEVMCTADFSILDNNVQVYSHALFSSLPEQHITVKLKWENNPIFWYNSRSVLTKYGKQDAGVMWWQLQKKTQNIFLVVLGAVQLQCAFSFQLGYSQYAHFVRFLHKLSMNQPWNFWSEWYGPGLGGQSQQISRAAIFHSINSIMRWPRSA